MEKIIYLSPLQGFTDFLYRKVYDNVFQGIDTYFIPYISLKNELLLKKYTEEILPENNPQKKVIPQVLASNGDELLLLAKKIENYGFSEINLNMGCPYPMVTNRKKGSGLLPFPEEVKKMLHTYFEKSNLKLSVKLRAGLIQPAELEKIIKVLNAFPLTEVILHPRIAKQMYKGEIIESAFRFFVENCQHKTVFNGDIFSTEIFRERSLQFPKVDTWMLGRGILMNPFLPSEIKGKVFTNDKKKEKLEKFHQLIFEEYSKKMDNPGNILNKMKQFWIYFSFNFQDNKKVFKKIKKANSINIYRAEVRIIMNREV